MGSVPSAASGDRIARDPSAQPQQVGRAEIRQQFHDALALGEQRADTDDHERRVQDMPACQAGHRGRDLAAANAGGDRVRPVGARRHHKQQVHDEKGGETARIHGEGNARAPIAKWLPLHRECGRFAQRYPRWTRLIAQSSLSYNRKGGSRSPSSPRASPSASRAASAVYATSRPNVSCAGTAPRSTRLADRSLLADRNRTRRGHIHALINPQSPESRSSFEVADEHPPDPAEWSERAVTKRGSWWPDHVEWLSTRSGGLKPAPNALGNRRYQAHAKAPGTYVHAR